MFDDRNREITSFDFNDSDARERIEAWIAITRAKIMDGKRINDKDLGKIAELLSIILKEGGYQLPKKRGERKKQDISYEQLVCWYSLKLELKENLRPKEAKKQTAERFYISEKTVERYSTKHKKNIKKLIIKKEEHDEKYDNEASIGFEEHLSLIKESGRGFKEKALK